MIPQQRTLATTRISRRARSGPWEKPSPPATRDVKLMSLSPSSLFSRTILSAHSAQTPKPNQSAVPRKVTAMVAVAASSTRSAALWVS
jgi:hypothetical protein